MDDEFWLLLDQILSGEYLSSWIASLDDGTFKVRFACGNNGFISKRTFATIEEADEWSHARLDDLSDMLSKLGFTRRTDAHPN